VNGKQLYSNGGDTVWFIMRAQVQSVPYFSRRPRTGAKTTLWRVADTAAVLHCLDQGRSTQDELCHAGGTGTDRGNRDALP